MKPVIKRLITGLIYIVVISMAVLLKKPSLYVAVFSLMIMIAIMEFCRLAKNNRTRPLRSILDGIAGAYLFSVSLISAVSGFERILFAPYIFYIIYIMVRAIYSEVKGLPQELSRTVLGQIYIAGGMSLANFILFSSTPATASFDQARSTLLFFIFVIIWMNDTGAYIIGSSFGKKRLFPSLSPLKSWEGFWGGLVFSMISAAIFGHFFIEIDKPLYIWVILGALISVGATWGDLFESSLKRNAGVKDSGRMLPGHGGMLDRIDSILFAIPVAYIGFILFGI
ncbi:phosphatidate cytidylyltransferase [Porphyromonas pogonae]|uniref:phosphatidate cytidylyltransferase n=1 Tax=Porphyromonas pogonae TaxID=867595 RepID=UPI002E75EEAF|nr:CDP-archaeol synthase [Porphyromonas pogonae]